MIWPWPRRRTAPAIVKINGGGTPPGRGRGGGGGQGNGKGGGPLGPVAVGNLGGTSSASPGLSISWNHTCGGNKKLLVVQISFDRGAGSTVKVNDVSYNGVAMTALEQDLGGQDGRLSVWYLVNPASGNNTVLVNWDGGTGTVTDCRTASRDFTGVHQTTPLGTKASTTGGDASPTATITDAVANGLTIDFLNVHGGAVSQRTFSVNCSQTQQYNVTAPTGGNGHGGGYKSGAGSVTMCWAINTGAEWRLVVVAVKPG